MEENQKNEFFYKKLQETYEFYKKNIGKNDEFSKELKNASAELKLQEKEFLKSHVSFDLIRSSLNNLFLSFELKNVKILEKSLSTWETFITKDILDHSTLDEGMKIIIKNIGNKTADINDEALMFKILNFFVAIYKSNKVIISSNLLVIVIKIFLHTYLSQKNPYSQNVAKLSLVQLLEQLTEKIDRSFIKANSLISLSSTRNLSNLNDTNLLSNQKHSKERQISDNDGNMEDYLRFSGSYLNHLSDLIEINDKLNHSEPKQNELLKNYINFCSKSTDTEQESFEHLERILKNSAKKANDEKNSLGTHGRCVNCCKPSIFFSDKIYFPVCSNFCDNVLSKLKQNIDSKFSELNMYKEDFIISIKNLAKLSMKESKTPNSEMTGLKLREFCLEILHNMLSAGSKFFQNDQKLILVLKEHLLSSLITNILSSEEKIFKLSISLFLTLLSNFREHMKKEIYMFVSRVLMKILKSEILGFSHKETILDCFKRLSEKSNFLLEIYANFDCDFEYENVFIDLISLFTKIIQGLYKSNKYSHIIKNNQELVLRSKCMNILHSFLNNLSSNIEAKDQLLSLTGNMQDNILGNQDKKKDDERDNIADQTQIEHFNDNIKEIKEAKDEETILNDEIIDKMNLNLKIKSIYSQAVQKFAISFKKCQSFLIENNLLASEKLFNQTKDKVQLITNASSDQVSSIEHVNDIDTNVNINSLIPIPGYPKALEKYLLLFLKDNADKLAEYTYDDYQSTEFIKFIKQNLKDFNSSVLGSFLCGSKPINKLFLRKYIDSCCFTDMHIFDSMRTLFTDFKIEGEGQIVDRIMQIFGEKYTRDNPTTFPNPDIAYYLGFSIMMLQTDLHRTEVTEKMSVIKFINQFNLCMQGGLDNDFLTDVYNRVLSDPIKIPGQKISQTQSVSKNKKDLMKQEKESIIKSTYDQLNIRSKDLYDFSIYIDNEHVKNLLNSTWTYFLSTFATLLTEQDDIQIIKTCLENMLYLAKLCGYLGLETIAEVFVNAILQKAGLMEGKDLTVKNFECIKALIEFYATNGVFMTVGWLGILNIISKIEHYHNLTADSKSERDLFSSEIKKKNKKNPDKEIEIEFRNAEIVAKSFSIAYCDNIFSSTANFSAEGIIAFINALCEVSKIELSSPFNPRNYSLHKLTEVADYNLMRIQIQWVKIWKLISDYIVNVADLYHDRNISVDAIDSLRQIVSKLLKKSDLAIYHFQIDFFKPFEAIFKKEGLSLDKYELILGCLAYIVTSSKNIHAGWIIIFNIIKVSFKRKESKLNEEGMKLLNLISEDFSLINPQTNQEVFKGYIECLCHMYLEPNLKKIAFDNMLSVMNKVYNKPSVGKLQQYNLNIDKKFEFLKVFFYGIDDLIPINVLEHLNLVFEIISFNKDIFFSSELFNFIYLYYAYFKPCILINLINLGNSKKYTNMNNNKKALIYSELVKDNLLNCLTTSLDDENQIKEIRFIDSSNNGGESKNIMISFLKQIGKSYDQDFELILKKNQLMMKMKSNDLQEYLSDFLRKFSFMITSCSGEKNLDYNFFIEDLIITIIQQSSFSNLSSVILILKNKLFDEVLIDWNETFWNTLLENLKDKLNQSLIQQDDYDINGIISLCEFTIIVIDKCNNDEIYIFLFRIIIDTIYLLKSDCNGNSYENVAGSIISLMMIINKITVMFKNRNKLDLLYNKESLDKLYEVTFPLITNLQMNNKEELVCSLFNNCLLFSVDIFTNQLRNNKETIWKIYDFVVDIEWNTKKEIELVKKTLKLLKNNNLFIE